MRPDNPSILTINRGSSSIKLAEYQLGEPLKRSTAGVISTDGSRVTLHVIRTDEDLMIARSVCGIRQADAGNGRIDHENQHRYIGTASQEARRDRC